MNKNLSINLFKLICSFLVIAIHTGPFFELNKYIAIGFTSIIARVAVPFFFCISGYFYTQKVKDNTYYTNKYIFKILKIYLVWGIFYFPYDFLYVRLFKKQQSLIYATLGYIRQSIFDGMSFHLWYLPALILAIFLINILHKKEIKKCYIIILAILCYLIGLLGTGYYNLVSGLKIISIYEKVFITTRKGLFFGFPFVCMGYLIEKLNLNKFNYKYIYLNLLFFSILLSLETFILKYFKISKMSDMSLFLPIVVFWIVLFLLKNPFENFLFNSYLVSNDYSLGIYVIHVFFIIIFSKIFWILNLLENRTLLFLLVSLSSFIFSYFLKKLAKKNKIKQIFDCI